MRPGWPVRLFARVAVAMAMLVVTASPYAQSRDELLRSRAFESGGDFTLTDHHGKPFHLSSARGKVALLFFGYTSCAEACPVAMAKIAAVYKRLGGSQRVVTLFVSLDPARDTTIRAGQIPEPLLGRRDRADRKKRRDRRGRISIRREV